MHSIRELDNNICECLGIEYSGGGHQRNQWSSEKGHRAGYR